MQLKHLLVFLLILVVSVADSTVYSQENPTTYYQSSKLIHKKKFNYTNIKHLTFKHNIVSRTYFLTFLSHSIHLKNAFKKPIQLTIKLQKQLTQKIALLNIQHTFLTVKITSGNSISNLYIA
jgi:hypothetical protein